VAHVFIDRDRCKGCELCVAACPQHVLAMAFEPNSRGLNVASVVQPRHCIGCRLCYVTCPDAAVELRITGTYYRYAVG
jgi:2-oxoglutarate ferredoxin oxidoreductase subunit delta